MSGMGTKRGKVAKRLPIEPMVQTDEVMAAVRAIMASRYQPKVGDRVRVTGSASECRSRPDDDSPQADAGTLGHDDWEIGLTGIVIGVGESLEHCPDHDVDVRWDAPPSHTIARMCTYAPVELELVEP